MTRSKKDGGFAFRDLHTFNMAMMARQGWHLLQNLDTLCGKVLKAKYFLDSSVLEALGHLQGGHANRPDHAVRTAEVVQRGLVSVHEAVWT